MATSFYGSAFFGGEFFFAPTQSAFTPSGGWFPAGRRRTLEDIRLARIDFGVLPPDQPIKPAKPSAYFEQSTKLVRAISAARSESASLRTRIADLEAEIMAEGVRRTLSERARIEHALLLAQQRLTLLSVQEASLIEDMEIIDISFFALIAIMMITQ